jgi:type III restriction enzyme
MPDPILAVDSKGAYRRAADDRLIGELWANLSEGECQFVMVMDKRRDWVGTILQ